MAFETFNSVGGISVGIPPVPVIYANGIATLTGLQVAGISNLGSINNVIILGGENGYFLQTDGSGGLTWAPAGNGGNGGNGIPGGANSQVQFNNDGDFGGDAGFVYDKVNNILTVTGNIVSYNYSSSGNVISNNFIGNTLTVANINASRITTTGNLSAGNASLGNIAAANFYIGNGSLLTGINASSANFANFAGNVTVSNQPNITSVGTLTSLKVNGTANIGNLGVNGGVFAITLSAIGNANVGNINSGNGIFQSIAGPLVTANQPNVTSLGTLTSLTISGNVSLGSVANVHIDGGLPGYVLTTNGNGNLSWQAARPAVTAAYVTANNQPNITSTGTLTKLTVNGQTNLGLIGNVHINGGNSGYLLTTNGSGDLSWQEPTSGGNIGGNNTQIQYNNNGTFGADENFTYNTNTNTVTIAGDLVANSITIGSGIYKFSRTSVYFATSATTSETLLMEFPTSNTAGLDFTIISTDPVAGNRQICKLEAVYYDNTVHYSEYNTIQVNGPVGNFAVTYEPGDISNPPTSSLYVFPTTSNMTTYKIQVTAYSE